MDLFHGLGLLDICTYDNLEIRGHLSNNMKDAMNAQGWEAASSIIALGLTWYAVLQLKYLPQTNTSFRREAVYCIIMGSVVDTIPLMLNGAIGAHLHVPFPVIARSSFGFYFSRFAVVVRMITALFWHAIQTYTGSTAMTQCIRAIWPSFLDIPNHIPQSVGITSQQMVSHFVFWSIQFPFLLQQPHKLKWFFVFKAVVVLVTSVATVIVMTKKAGECGFRCAAIESSRIIMLMLTQEGPATSGINSIPSMGMKDPGSSFQAFLPSAEAGRPWQPMCLILHDISKSETVSGGRASSSQSLLFSLVSLE